MNEPIVTLPPGEVHIWTIDLGASLDHPVPSDRVLSTEEHAQADRFRHPHLRRRYITAHVETRHILATYLAVQPRTIAFLRTSYGKPHVVQQEGPNPLHFSLSHSEDRALVAVATRQPVGVDIERIDADTDEFAVAQRYFSEHEKAELSDSPETERLEHFFRLWVCKEAYVKARGEGVIDRLSTFTISFDTDSSKLLEDSRDPVAPQRWSVRLLDTPLGFAAAVAVAGDIARIRARNWPARI